MPDFGENQMPRVVGAPPLPYLDGDEILPVAVKIRRQRDLAAYWNSITTRQLAQFIGAEVSDTPPRNPLPGRLWFNCRGLFVWTGTAWVSAFPCRRDEERCDAPPIVIPPQRPPVTIDCEAPDPCPAGQLWWTCGRLFVSTGEAWVAASCCDATSPSALPDIANDTVLGNVSGATAQPAALTAAQLALLLGSYPASQPGLVPAAGSAPTAAPTNQFLSSAGRWQVPGTNAQLDPASPYTVLPTDDYIELYGAGDVTLVLPPVTAMLPGKTLRILWISRASGASLTLSPTGVNGIQFISPAALAFTAPLVIPGQPVNGPSGQLLLITDGGNWFANNIGPPLSITNAAGTTTYQVPGIVNLAGAQPLLRQAASDAAAAALSPAVPVGGFYANGSQVMQRQA